MELYSGIHHLQPPDIYTIKKIIWEWLYFTAVYDKIMDSMASESLDCLVQYVLIAYIPTVGYSFVSVIIRFNRLHLYVLSHPDMTHGMRLIVRFASATNTNMLVVVIRATTRIGFCRIRFLLLLGQISPFPVHYQIRRVST